MMGRMSLREVREALAVAKAKGTKAPAPAPTVEELESLARLLEQEAETGAPAEEPHLESGVLETRRCRGNEKRKRMSRPSRTRGCTRPPPWQYLALLRRLVSLAFGPEGGTWPRHPDRWSRHP